MLEHLKPTNQKIVKLASRPSCTDIDESLYNVKNLILYNI